VNFFFSPGHFAALGFRSRRMAVKYSPVYRYSRRGPAILLGVRGHGDRKQFACSSRGANSSRSDLDSHGRKFASTVLTRAAHFHYSNHDFQSVFAILPDSNSGNASANRLLRQKVDRTSRSLEPLWHLRLSICRNGFPLVTHCRTSGVPNPRLIALSLSKFVL